jgi:transposase
MDSATVYVGIDVAKAQVVIAVRPTTECWEIANQQRDFPLLVRRLLALKPTRIIVEATGTFHQPLVRALAAAGLPVRVANPRQVRAFAKAIGRLAKTDVIDAHVLAHFAEAVPLKERPLLSEEEEALRSLVVRRRQLVKMQTAETNRLAAGATGFVARQTRQHLAFLQRQIAAVEHALAAQLQQPQWRERAEILRSIPGIGPQSVLALLTELPELGRIGRKQLAALAGVAPLNRDSGTLRGHRSVYGGRRAMRSTLYMAAVTATRAHPDIHIYYQHLLAAGKPHKVAFIACLRKLLILANTLIREHRPWRQELPLAA